MYIVSHKLQSPIYTLYSGIEGTQTVITLILNFNQILKIYFKSIEFWVV